MSGLLIDEIKLRIHQIVNHLQAILGYLELGEYDKATKQVLLACQNVHQLEKMLSSNDDSKS